MKKSEAQKVVHDALRSAGFDMDIDDAGGWHIGHITHPEIGGGKIHITFEVHEMHSSGWRSEPIGRSIVNVGGHPFREKKGAFDLATIVSFARKELELAYEAGLREEAKDSLAERLETEFGPAIASVTSWRFDDEPAGIQLEAREDGKVRLKVTPFEGDLEQIRRLVAVLKEHTPELVEVQKGEKP